MLRGGYGVCQEVDSLLPLFSRPDIVQMHIETLDAVHRESKRLPPIQKVIEREREVLVVRAGSLEWGGVGVGGCTSPCQVASRELPPPAGAEVAKHPRTGGARLAT